MHSVHLSIAFLVIHLRRSPDIMQHAAQVHDCVTTERVDTRRSSGSVKEIPVQNLTKDWYLSHSPGCFASVANITNDEPGRESDSDWIFVQTRLLSAVKFINSDIDTFELWVKRAFKQVVASCMQKVVFGYGFPDECPNVNMFKSLV